MRSEPDSAPDAPIVEVVAPDATGSDVPPESLDASARPAPTAPETPTAPAAPPAVDAEQRDDRDIAQDVARARPVPRVLPVVDVADLDWGAVHGRVNPGAMRARLREVVERMEALLDRDGGPGLLFDVDRADANDRVIRVADLDPAVPLWIVGDLHGDLLALEAALEVVRHSEGESGAVPRLLFLGDFFDDGGYGLEVLLRVFEVILEAPASVCVLAGNHDEALHYTGARFTATVIPSDFSEFLNAHLAHEWIARAGKLAVRLFAAAPRALFLPDGLLATHGGFPLVDLHADLRTTGDWNDPRCLSDFTWTRAHPRARKKMPNRTSRGSQFGYEDFAAFCAVSEALGRPVTHMVRGHDHVDERYEIPVAYAAHPVLTTVALSRQLGREMSGPYERMPTIARWVSGALPQVYRLCVPGSIVREVYPPDQAGADESPTIGAATGEST